MTDTAINLKRPKIDYGPSNSAHVVGCGRDYYQLGTQ